MALGSTTALAAEDDNKTVIYGFNNVTAKFVDSSEEQMTVTYADSALVDGGQYLILMVKSTVPENISTMKTIDETAISYDVTESSILYIDQVTATNGQIEFKVYPSSVQDSVILITGASGTLIAAIVDAKYILGDVNGDGIVDLKDLSVLARYFAGYSETIVSDAADVDADKSLDLKDLSRLARILAGYA
jgi:hypothetical protein